uniref:Uncharacterized protein n=1 Tax=Brassica campestris TaxID=3711 RepID=M4DPB1_BRACM
MWIALSVSETSLRHQISIKRSRRKLPPLLNRLRRRLLESDRKEIRRKKMKKTICLRNHLPLRCCHVPTRDDTEKPLIKARLCKAVAPLKSLSRDPLKLTLSRSQALSSSNPLHAQALSSSNPLKLRLSLVR